jgi:hypothetical protein
MIHAQPLPEPADLYFRAFRSQRQGHKQTGQ